MDLQPIMTQNYHFGGTYQFFWKFLCEKIYRNLHGIQRVIDYLMKIYNHDMAEVIVENSHNCEMAIGKDYVYGPEGYIVWDKVGGIELKAGVNRIKVKNDLIKRGFRFVRNADTVKSVAFENLSKVTMFANIDNG